MRTLTTATDLPPVHGCILVPTMGALHQGHAALIRRGADLARDRNIAAGCVVSIFVNPTQFNQRSDYDRYPRTLDEDAALCAAAGATAVFVPDEHLVYPPPPAQPVPQPPLPLVATEPKLEDRFRPGHFAGVCQVVARLFELTRPAASVFGEKDWQQLQVVTAMARALPGAPEIIAHPTLRAADGLALSSRNRFLSGLERAAALALPRALEAAGPHGDPVRAETAMQSQLANAGLRIEYAAIRESTSLRPISSPVHGARALIAAWSGGVRLIDNAPWPATL